MNKDGVIQYDWIEENVHQDVKDVVVTALRKCKNINGNKFNKQFHSHVTNNFVLKIWL